MDEEDAAEAVACYLDAGAEVIGRSREHLLADPDLQARLIRRLALLALRLSARCLGASWQDLDAGARWAGIPIRSTAMRKYYTEALAMTAGASPAAVALATLCDQIGTIGATRHALGMGKSQ